MSSLFTRNSVGTVIADLAKSRAEIESARLLVLSAALQIDKFKAKNGYNLTGEAVDAYLAMYVLKDALERAGSLEPAKIREALAATNLTDGPGMIVGYDAVKFDATGQNEMASPVIVQIADLGQGLERVTIWPKAARRAGYTPVFPVTK